MTTTHATYQMLQAPLNLGVQATTLQPEAFQAELMENISTALLRTPSPPCLLRAPTGAGKTFVMGQVLGIYAGTPENSVVPHCEH